MPPPSNNPNNPFLENLGVRIEKLCHDCPDDNLQNVRRELSTVSEPNLVEFFREHLSPYHARKIKSAAKRGGTSNSEVLGQIVRAFLREKNGAVVDELDSEDRTVAETAAEAAAQTLMNEIIAERCAAANAAAKRTASRVERREIERQRLAQALERRRHNTEASTRRERQAAEQREREELLERVENALRYAPRDYATYKLLLSKDDEEALEWRNKAYARIDRFGEKERALLARYAPHRLEHMVSLRRGWKDEEKQRKKNAKASLTNKTNVAAGVIGQKLTMDASADAKRILRERDEAKKKQEEKACQAKNESCAVCWAESASMASVPCGHVSCCATCSATLSTCPICRQETTIWMKVYYSLF